MGNKEIHNLNYKKCMKLITMMWKYSFSLMLIIGIAYLIISVGGREGSEIIIELLSTLRGFFMVVFSIFFTFSISIILSKIANYKY